MSLNECYCCAVSARSRVYYIDLIGYKYVNVNTGLTSCHPLLERFQALENRQQYCRNGEKRGRASLTLILVIN